MSEDLWFPEFGLRKNPFALSDKRSEMQNNEVYEPVETQATRLVQDMIDYGGRVIIDGPKGCGKSTTLYYMMMAGYASETIVISSRSLMELVFELLVKVLSTLPNEQNEDGVIGENKVLLRLNSIYGGTVRGFLMAWIPKASNAHLPSKFVCEYGRCIMGHRCDFPTFNNDVTFSNVARYVSEVISKQNNFCPLAEWILVRLFEKEKPSNMVFMFDVPDEVGVDVPSKYFKNFISELGDKSKANMILMATRKQFNSLTRHDFFQRWNNRKFPSMTGEELKAMCAERLQNQKANSNPISDDGWSYLVASSMFNPRTVIWRAGQVLEAMRKEGKNEPADVEYVEKILLREGLGGVVSNDDALEAVLKDLRDHGRKWVKVKEIATLMNTVYKVGIEPISLGKMLTRMELVGRKNPDAEYRVG